MEHSRTPDSDESLSQQAYAKIQQKLLNGEIRVGQLVSELALAENIGMSRTPVREAFGQLVSAGLFTVVPRVGTIVRLPTSRELFELYEAREALESYASVKAAHALTPQQLKVLERLQQELAGLAEEVEARGLESLEGQFLQRFFDADMKFHDIIVQSTRNRRTVNIVNEFRVIQRVFEYDCMDYTPATVKLAANEHREILHALQQSDGDSARLAMANHIRSSREQAIESFNQYAAFQAEILDDLSTATDKAVGPKFNRWRRRRRSSPS
ncbi:GntR family transcriptional regulator [bacterium]|nr:MAG: GntR family transcriptional regulator [bacterium]